MTAEEVPAGLIADLADQLLGIKLEPTGTLGFVVTKVRTGSAATRIGIREGDLHLGVNGRALNGEDDLRRAVSLRNEHAPAVLLEASGGITEVEVRAVAETGVDRISVGALTHSARALDVALDVAPGAG